MIIKVVNSQKDRIDDNVQIYDGVEWIDTFYDDIGSKHLSAHLKNGNTFNIPVFINASETEGKRVNDSI